MAPQVTSESWRTHFRQHGRDYVVTGVLAIVFMFAVTSLYSFGRQAYLRNQDVTEWFEYHAIRYNGVDEAGRGGFGSLKMISDMEVKRPLELRFHDVLRCREFGDTEDRSFVSQNPGTSAFIQDPYERRLRGWLYNADFVRGQDCIVRSTIVGEVEGITKSLTVDSSPFVIEPLG